jgi:3-oxoacyl-[acyl-carrier-protein] synthase II
MDGRPGRRVAVTGIGVVAACGVGQQAFWDGLFKPAPGGKTLPVPDWDPLPYFVGNAKLARRADPFEQFAMAAAMEAVEQAGVPPGDPGRKGVIIATGVGGLHVIETSVEVRLEKGDRRVSPFLVPMMMPNAAGAGVSMRYGFQGPVETICTACAASTHGIGYAARLIAWGRCDTVLAGGAEGTLTPTAIAGFANMTALSTIGLSRPFDVDRDGFVMGEGAAVLMLEEWSLAEARGARILGEILGAASNADAHHITAPAPGGTGAIRCMEMALADAGLGPSDITHINAHGTSTPLNDAAEAEAITKVFGTPGPAITAIKGVTGHSLGAAGALEAAAVLLAMEHRTLPPTMGTVNVDPAMTIDLVLGQPRPWTPGPSLSNSFGFGGHNGTLVIGPPET